VPDDPPVSPLSETELAILVLVATGATNMEIARQRHISEATVKKHLTNINLKLDTTNRTEAVRRALEQGLITVPTPEVAGADPEAARRLTEELERTRRRSRHILRWSAVAGVLALVGVALAGYALASGVIGRAAPPTPTAAPAVTTTGAAWVPGIKLPSPRTGLALANVENRLYAIGGLAAGGALTETLLYDKDRLAWLARSPKPTAVGEVAAAVVQGRVVVPGGCGSDGRATAVVEVYDPAADRWSTTAPLPEPRCGYALAVVEGKVFLFGGRNGRDPVTASDAVWRFDLDDDSWASDERLPVARADAAAVAVGNGVHLLGGRDREGQRQTGHWIFRPFAREAKWELDSAPKLPQGRAGLVAATVPVVNELYVVGGGWDRIVEPGALVLGLGSAEGWAPFVDVRGFTPQRGAAITTFMDGKQLFIAGGTAATGRLLDQVQIYVRFRPVPIPQFAPPPR
jgi:DNA-binding CsgD family transcriptional regulator